MSHITVLDDTTRNVIQESGDHDTIVKILTEAGGRFERWHATQAIKAGDSQEDVLAAYKADIDRLVSEDGYQTVDVVSLTSDHPDKTELRKKYVSEHTHSEDEVRFFVDGQGLFSLHIGDKVYEILCEKGDLISVPANTPHWFDMGPNPHFVCIRLFDNTEGWVAHYTGSDIADHCNRLNN